jgi:RNA polymerase sigma-32 factor
MALDGYSDQILPRQARRAELLDAETEARLARAWRDRGDTAALHRLVTAYMRLAIAMAVKYRRYGASSPDLTQEAAIGLMKAAEKFDPDRGHRFSTYAIWWIKAQLQDYVMRNWSLVRTGSTTGQKALFFNLRRIEARLVREARERGEVLEGPALRRAIADDLGVTLAEVAMMEGRLSGSDASLNATQAGEDEGREWIEALEDEGPQAAEAVQAAHDLAALRRHLATAMGELTPREARIVRARQLEEAPRTLADLGAEMNLSKERVRQLEAQAFAKLRRALEAQGAGFGAFLA